MSFECLGKLCSGNSPLPLRFGNKKIKESVLSALGKVKYLIVCENRFNKPIAFLGTEKGRLEMLFVSPQNRGRGVGKKLLNHAIKKYDISEVAVNEQNSQAVGFYEHMGFKPHRRADSDEEGRPYPLLYMKLSLAIQKNGLAKLS